MFRILLVLVSMAALSDAAATQEEMNKLFELFVPMLDEEVLKQVKIAVNNNGDVNAKLTQFALEADKKAADLGTGKARDLNQGGIRVIVNLVAITAADPAKRANIKDFQASSMAKLVKLYKDLTAADKELLKKQYPIITGVLENAKVQELAAKMPEIQDREE